MRKVTTRTDKPEPTIKRGAAAVLLGVTPRTLRREEIRGNLTPIRRNCRLTVYRLSEVEKLKLGDIPTDAASVQAARAIRGEFAALRPAHAQNFDGVAP